MNYTIRTQPASKSRTRSKSQVRSSLNDQRQGRFQKAIFNSISEFKLAQNVLHNYGQEAISPAHLKMIAELLQPQIQREKVQPKLLQLIENMFSLILGGQEKQKLTVGEMVDLEHICSLDSKAVSALMSGKPQISSTDLALLIQSYNFTERQVFQGVMSLFNQKDSQQADYQVDLKQLQKSMARFKGGSFSALTIKKALGLTSDKMSLKWLLSVANQPKRINKKSILDLNQLFK